MPITALLLELPPASIEGRPPSATGFLLGYSVAVAVIVAIIAVSCLLLLLLLSVLLVGGGVIITADIVMIVAVLLLHCCCCYRCRVVGFLLKTDVAVVFALTDVPFVGCHC